MINFQDGPIDVDRLVVFDNGDGTFTRPQKWKYTHDGSEPDWETPRDVYYHVLNPVPADWDYAVSVPVPLFQLVGDERQRNWGARDLTNREQMRSDLRQSIKERQESEHLYRLSAEPIAEMTPAELKAAKAVDPELQEKMEIMMLKAGLYMADISGIDTETPDA